MTTTNKKPVICCVMPHYGTIEVRAARSFFSLASKMGDDRFDLVHFEGSRSLLAHNFNRLVCDALNNRETWGLTHFAMKHADIDADDGWLDVLFDELTAHQADVVSAVVPIKCNDGITSTAIDSADDPWSVERRLTMHEVMQLPETFSAADCGYPGRALGINTGCWIADINRVWPKDAPAGVVPHFFTIADQLRRCEDGLYRADVMPEDWGFGRQLYRSGLKVLATRKVKLRHIGAAAYSNGHAWGLKDIDHMANGQPLPALADKTPLAQAG